MPKPSEYAENKDILVENAIKYFKQVEDRLLPATMLGCMVTNFKPLEDIKRAESRKINNFFVKANQEEYEQNQKKI